MPVPLIGLPMRARLYNGQFVTVDGNAGTVMLVAVEAPMLSRDIVGLQPRPSSALAVTRRQAAST
jgi:hypothetical protein